MNRLYWGKHLRFIILFFFLILIVACASVPEDISSEFFNIGNAYYDVAEYEKAIEYYQRALDESRDKENIIRYNLAIAYSESGRVSKGVEHFEFLLNQDPENLKVLQSLAYGYYLLGDLDISLDYYNKILLAFEYDTVALFNKAAILIEDNMFEAEAILNKLYSIDNSVEVVLLLGRIYSEREEWAVCVELFEQAIINNKNNTELLEGLLFCYVNTEQYDNFLSYIDDLILIEDSDKFGDLYFRKANVELLKTDDFNGGLISLKKAISNGFHDQQKINSLLVDENLINAEQIKLFFESRDLLEKF